MTLRRTIPALLFAALAGGLAFAQAAPFPEAALDEARRAAERALRFEQAAALAGNAADRARAEAEALVARIEASEAGISAAEARVRLLDSRLEASEAKLAERQQPVLRLTAALQTLARRPPALALAQPGSIQDLARVRAVLGTTLPVVRERSAGLRSELDQAGRLRAQGAEALQSLVEQRGQLGRQRLALARLEEAQRARSARLGRSALAETDRATAFSEEARDLASAARSRAFQDRIGSELAALPPPPPRPGSLGGPGSGAAPPPYRLPLEGRLVTGFGEISDAGIHARGVALRPAADTIVVAPRPGRIAYAGRFRSYGEVVIVDHGGGWTTTVTNLAALRVARGAKVAAGDPIGRAGGNSEVGVELRRDGHPQSIAAFILPPRR